MSDATTYLAQIIAQDRPIVFAQARDALCGALPLLTELADTPQDAIWHGEGDVAAHTGLVLEALEEELEVWGERLSAHQRAVLRLAALCHDIAKPLTTRAVERDGVTRIIAPRHAERGASWLALRLCGLGLAPEVAFEVLALVRHHHDPKQLVVRDAPDALYHKLARRAWMSGLFLLERADMRGRVCDDLDEQLMILDLFRLRCEEVGCWQATRAGLSQAQREGLIAPLAQALAETGPDDVIERALVEGLWGYDAGQLVTWHEARARAYNLQARHTQLVVLCGPSGAGKSAWVRAHCAGFEVVSMDALRETIAGDRADQSENGRVFQAAQEALKVALRAQRPVVWDATTLRLDARRKLLRMGRDYGAHTTLVSFWVGPEQLAQRNRERAHSVHDNILRRQLDGFEWPDQDEAHRVCVVDGAGQTVRDTRAMWRA